MSEIRNRDRILEAIDQLRKRKARPDVNRICSFMFRRFAVNCIETKVDLQKLIDAEVVIKVDYKGSTSYRNASKWAMLPSYKYKKEIDTSSLISSAVAELIVLEPDYLDIGVPDYELEAHMISKDSRRFSKKNLEGVLKREVEIGTLVKLDNGNYFLGEHSSINSSSTMDRPSASHVGSPGKNSTKLTKHNLAARQTPPRQKKIKLIDKHSDNSNDSDKMKPSDDQNNSSEGANVGFRVGGRQKRARVVFDPSDNNLPTRVNKRRGPGRPLGSLNKSAPNNSSSASTSPAPTPQNPKTTGSVTPTSPQPQAPRVNTAATVKPFTKSSEAGSPTNPSLCYICHSYGNRVKGVPERLINCIVCSTIKAHPTCLENNNDGPGRDGWFCNRCKCCVVCNVQVKDQGTRVICALCRDTYHIQCHNPPIPERARTKQISWHCCKCSDASPPTVTPTAAPTAASVPAPAAAPAPAPTPVPAPAPEPHGISKKEELSIKERLDALTPLKKELANVPPLPPSEPKPKDVPANCLQDPFEDIPVDESIPDAKHWTTNQVYQYFSTHFKPELAQVFKEQDIDGQSLLLMKRMDVLTSLCLKLGPALKVYGHVRKLQTRKSHPKIFWS